MDKKDEIIKLRITKKDKLLLRYLSSRANMNVSEYLSMLIDTSLRPTKDKLRNGELSYADIETYINNKLQFREFFEK